VSNLARIRRLPPPSEAEPSFDLVALHDVYRQARAHDEAAKDCRRLGEKMIRSGIAAGHRPVDLARVTALSTQRIQQIKHPPVEDGHDEHHPGPAGN
jgi:hypothetical protein